MKRILREEMFNMMTPNQLREISSYPITEFRRVKSEDVDGVSYFSGNVGESIKTITYRDSSGNFAKKEVFTYESVSGNPLNASNIYTSRLSNFAGVIGQSTLPSSPKENDFYYISKNITINGESFEKNEAIGYVDVGDGVMRWRRVTVSSKGIQLSK